MIFLNSAINPLAYGYGNETMQKAFRITFPFFFKGKPKFKLQKGMGHSVFTFTKVMEKITSKAETKAQAGFKQVGEDLMAPVTAGFEKSAVIIRRKNTFGEFAKKVARRTSSLAQRKVTIKPITPNSKCKF